MLFWGAHFSGCRALGVQFAEHLYTHEYFVEGLQCAAACNSLGRGFEVFLEGTGNVQESRWLVGLCAGVMVERQRREGGPSSGAKQESSREAAWRMTAAHAWALVAAGRMRKVVLLCCILEGLSADLPALMASFTPPTISCTGLSAVTGTRVRSFTHSALSRFIARARVCSFALHLDYNGCFLWQLRLLPLPK